MTVLWTGPPGNISPDNPTPTMDSGKVYESTVTFSSLETSDSGDYTCTATVSPDPSSEFVAESGEGTETLNIIVGKAGNDPFHLTTATLSRSTYSHISWPRSQSFPCCTLKLRTRLPCRHCIIHCILYL